MADAISRQPPADPPGLLGGVGTQAVIDRQRRDAAFPPAGPTRRQKRQAKAVRAAGNSDGHMGPGLERAQTGHQPFEGVIVKRRGRALLRGTPPKTPGP